MEERAFLRKLSGEEVDTYVPGQCTPDTPYLPLAADGSTILANGQRVPSLSAGDGSEFEAQRAAFQQRMGMGLRSPVGAGLYVATHLAGGSQEAQDTALAIGAGLEEALTMAAGVRGLKSSPNPVLPLRQSPQAPIRDLRNNLVLDSKGNPLVANGGAAASGTQANPVKIVIDSTKYPEAAAHINDAVSAGKPAVGRINRAGASANRAESLKNVKTMPGLDRDEFPPAVLDVGGEGASVRYIAPADNRGAGSSMGHQMRKLPDGTLVEITTQ